MVTIYTDGSCIPNPGNGGWAFVIVGDDNIDICVSGGQKNTTNNAMELTSVIEALIHCEDLQSFTIYSDSQYVINCATGKWQRKKNVELWEKYSKVSKGKNITWKWVKGHSNDYYNDLVDELARNEVLK